LLDKLKTKEVRDLYCVVFGRTPFPVPTEIPLNNMEPNQNEVRILLMLDEDPNDLRRFLLDTPKYIIGKYAEDLISYYLKSISEFEIILEHQQVIQDGITVSEIDYIIKHGGSYYHWELSYKFYLEKDGLWIGPHARDTLKNKLDTVINKQFAVIKSKALQNREPDIPWNELTSKFHLSGWAFVEGNDENWNSSMSIWMHRKDFIKQDGGQDYWLIADKEYWISPILLSAGELRLFHWKELIPKHVSIGADDQRAQLFLRLQKIHGDFVEIQRCFVVYNDWPN